MAEGQFEGADLAPRSTSPARFFCGCLVRSCLLYAPSSTSAACHRLARVGPPSARRGQRAADLFFCCAHRPPPDDPLGQSRSPTGGSSRHAARNSVQRLRTDDLQLSCVRKRSPTRLSNCSARSERRGTAAWKTPDLTATSALRSPDHPCQRFTIDRPHLRPVRGFSPLERLLESATARQGETTLQDARPPSVSRQSQARPRDRKVDGIAGGARGRIIRRASTQSASFVSSPPGLLFRGCGVARHVDV